MTLLPLMPTTVREVTVRLVEERSYRSCERIFQQVFGFDDADTAPAWQMLTSDLNGGLTLGAYVGSELVGCLHCIPGYDGSRSYLWIEAVAVLPSYQLQGIGSELLKAQRTVALQRGYDRMKWSTSVLGSRNLYIYVTKLGATVVGYRPELYRQVRVGRPGESSDDEVEIELSLRRAPGRPRTRMPALWASAGRDLVMSETEVVENGLRRLTHLGPPPPGRICALELPWDVQTLERRCRGLAVEWQLGLRGAIPHLIERGYRGIALMPDRAEQRAFLVFRRAGDG